MTFVRVFNQAGRLVPMPTHAFVNEVLRHLISDALARDIAQAMREQDRQPRPRPFFEPHRQEPRPFGRAAARALGSAVRLAGSRHPVAILARELIRLGLEHMADELAGRPWFGPNQAQGAYAPIGDPIIQGNGWVNISALDPGCNFESPVLGWYYGSGCLAYDPARIHTLLQLPLYHGKGGTLVAVSTRKACEFVPSWCSGGAKEWYAQSMEWMYTGEDFAHPLESIQPIVPIGVDESPVPVTEPERAPASDPVTVPFPAPLPFNLVGLRRSNAWPQGYEQGYALPQPDPLAAWRAQQQQAAREAAAEAVGIEAAPAPVLPPIFARIPHKGRETKLRTRAWRGHIAVRVLEEVVERGDQVQALWYALPEEVRKACRQRWVEGQFAAGVRRPAKVPPRIEMAKCIARHHRFLDPEGVVRELAWEALEDRIYGRLGQVTGRGLGRFQKSASGTVSPNAPNVWDGELGDGAHPLAPRLPLDALQEAVTQRRARDRERRNDALVRQFAIDEAKRRRSNRRAEMARRRAYREAVGR